MPIVRFLPGDVAPWNGRYALVGHYGESTDYTVWRDAGETLPNVTMTAGVQSMWFVLMDEANEQARVA